jgi:hypothetical protein
MKRLENEVACFNYSEAMHSSISKLSDLIGNNPVILEPFRNISDNIKDLFSSKGFQLYPTVKKTTLFFDPAADCFFKILHPLNLKNRILFLFTDKARSIYNLSEQLWSKGVKIQRVTAYGLIRKCRRPFFAIKKAEGESLYDILIRGGKKISMPMYRTVIDEVGKLHVLGYWLGDAHLSHIFITDEGVSGFIDIDGIRRNSPFMLKNLTKDLAGLNHPDLPLTEDEKKSLLNYYLNTLGIKNEEKFLRLLKYYTERRWKD